MCRSGERRKKCSSLISESLRFFESHEKEGCPLVVGVSTFFHSGISGLVNAVFNNHDFTYVILDNGITAMTGHQPHQGVDMSNFNLDGYGRIGIGEVVKALGI